MALRNQPYMPLYVQDFQTDEKLMECSAQATGVYIRLMCILHKSETYGTILLKQKDKQTNEQILNFACKVGKYMPYTNQVIIDSLKELISEGVLILDGDALYQKRMVKDNDISNKRSEAGKLGGSKNIFAKAKIEANYENENENINKVKNNRVKKVFIKPTIDEVIEYFKIKGYNLEVAKRAFEHYDIAEWHDTNGKKVLNWKQKMNSVWFKPENKNSSLPSGRGMCG